MRILYDAHPSLHRYMGELETTVGIGYVFRPKPMAEEHKAHYRKFVTEAWPLLEPDERLCGDDSLRCSLWPSTRLLDWDGKLRLCAVFAQFATPSTLRRDLQRTGEAFRPVEEPCGMAIVLHRKESPTEAVHTGSRRGQASVTNLR